MGHCCSPWSVFLVLSTLSQNLCVAQCLSDLLLALGGRSVGQVY